MLALGMSYRDIRGHTQEMYGIEISEATITGITGQLIPGLKAWQSRSLDTLYPFIWLDAIHYKIKESGRYVSKAVYTVLGINIEGQKELLGLYVSESEGANYWLCARRFILPTLLKLCIASLESSPKPRDFPK